MFLRFVLVLALFLVGGCKKKEPVLPEIMVSITSLKTVDKLEMMVRSYGGNTDRISDVLDSHDLTTEPYRLLLQLKPESRFENRVVLAIKGYYNEQQVAGETRFVTFADGRASVEMVLRSNYKDDDNDGFPAYTQECAATPEICDCNDKNPMAYPFRDENCDDPADNNCHGGNRDNCPCALDDPPLPCSNLPPNRATLAGIGACHFGYLYCRTDPVTGETKLDEVCDAGVPIEELPDNFIDDDCDGVVDEGTACTPGVSRPCFLGFVDDERNPDAEERDGASRRSLGECAKYPGAQVCENGIWSPYCVGVITPSRAEWPLWGFAETLGMCDGLDNDCDGLYDEELAFNNDSDGYTICGTTFTPSVDDPTVNTFTQGDLDPYLVDCNDGDPAIHPNFYSDPTSPGFAMEVCEALNVDEDCLCDHDDPNTENNDIGDITCGESYWHLNCEYVDRDLERDPAGLCREGPEPYFRGFFDLGGTRQGCYVCPMSYGHACDGATGRCTTRASDCEGCQTSAEVLVTERYEARSLCREPREGTCRDLVGPEWDFIPKYFDDFDDCNDELSCDGEGACHLPLGQSCVSGSQCESGHCADGVCCDTDCAANCYRCNLAGVCTAYTGEEDGTCVGGNSYCCNGTCVEPGGEYNTACGSGECAGGSWGCNGTAYQCTSFGIACDSFCSGDIYSNSTCSSLGVCDVTSTGWCPVCRACSDGGNVASCVVRAHDSKDTFAPNLCDDDGDCNLTSGECACDGAATPECKRADGVACTAGTQCASGHCVDGVCCDTGCDTNCYRCNLGGSVGTCTAYTGLGDGGGCSGDLSYCCNGTCVEPGGEYNTACGSGDCAGGSWGCNGTAARCSTSGNACAQCDGDSAETGNCGDGGTCSDNIVSNDCGVCLQCVYEDGSASCVVRAQYSTDPTDPNQCLSGGHCSVGSGLACACDGVTSTPECKRANGVTCTAGTQCASGYCVDGVCCNEGCTANCYSCNSEGHVGTCTAYTGAYDGGCTGSLSYCCNGTCVTPNGEFGGACGSGDCAGGSWGCNDTAAQCSTFGNACEQCNGDSAETGTCSDVGTCSDNIVSNDCGVCLQCVYEDGSASCVVRAQYSTDPTDPNRCVSGNHCSVGSGLACACDGVTSTPECKRANGVTCTAGTQCASGRCSSGATPVCY